MMKEDNIDAAKNKSVNFQDGRVSHIWDSERIFGDLVAKSLQLKKTAWDTYLLYDQGIRWEGDNIPQPSFWMAQLPSEWGIDKNRFLSPGKLAEQVHKLTGKRDERNLSDLKLHFHTRGLLEVLQKDLNLQEFINEVESSGTEGSPGSSCGC